MKRLVLLLYLLTIAVLTAATFVEHARGTAFASSAVYHTPWFCLLWALLGAGLVAAIVRRRLWRRMSVCLLHMSFLVILLGALLTYLTSEKGGLCLAEGQSAAAFADEEDGQLLHPLPFSLRLDSFRIARYPGTEAPADYASYLTVTDSSESGPRHVRVSMNHILTHRGYRFYQSSYDDGGTASYLSVNYDPYGTPVTYAGYALLAVAFVLVLGARRGEFLRLVRHPLLRRSAALALLMLVPCAPMAARRSLPTLPRERADSLALRQVMYNDRVAPLGTLARDFCLKLYGRASYHSLTAEQVLAGWLLRPDAWQNEPMILIKSAELRSRLGIQGRHARLADLFDAQGYRLQRLWQGGIPDAARTPLQKAVAETDEKVGLLLLLQQGGLIVPRPRDVAPLSPAKVRAELFYNRLGLPSWLFMVNLTLGLAAFALLILRSAGRAGAKRKNNCLPQKFEVLPQNFEVRPQIFEVGSQIFENGPQIFEDGLSEASAADRQERCAEKDNASLLHNTEAADRRAHNAEKGSERLLGSTEDADHRAPRAEGGRAHLWALAEGALRVLLTVSALLILADYALRWYIAGRVPLANGYETMLFMALSTAWAGALTCRRFRVMLPFGFLLSGFTLLVAHLGQSDPQITPLVPVLVSAWLSVHVSFMMVAYSLLGFVCLTGIAGLCLRGEALRLMLLGRLLLYPALLFLAVGIFLGAVWANQSWGSYWTWDPKEVWALITLMVYALPLHASLLPRLRRPRAFHLFAALAFACVLMTYFGVNYLLGGMHAYAG